MSDILRDFDKKNEIPKVKIPKFATGGICNDAIFPKLDVFSQIDEIVKDIRDRQDNAIAMEFTKCIGELLKKNGVVPKITEVRTGGTFDKDRNVIEERYGVLIEGLDFSEHDKVFEDKIATLEEKLLTSANTVEQNRRRSFVLEMKNQNLKNITKGYEDKIAELEKEVVNYKQAFDDKCADYGVASELLGKYQQENETLKKRIIELENFSCQAEQETESLVEKLKQRIAELESENKQLKHDIDKMATSKSEWIDRAVEWQQKCEKLESKETSDLPFDPLECANYLINATYERETSSLERTFAKAPDKVNSDRYTVDVLEQIAEHLLVYCKHNKECEE